MVWSAKPKSQYDSHYPTPVFYFFSPGTLSPGLQIFRITLRCAFRAERGGVGRRANCEVDCSINFIATRQYRRNHLLQSIPGVSLKYWQVVLKRQKVENPISPPTVMWNDGLLYRGGWGEESTFWDPHLAHTWIPWNQQSGSVITSERPLGCCLVELCV